MLKGGALLLQGEHSKVFRCYVPPLLKVQIHCLKHTISYPPRRYDMCMTDLKQTHRLKLPYQSYKLTKNNTVIYRTNTMSSYHKFNIEAQILNNNNVNACTDQITLRRDFLKWRYCQMV